MRGWPSAAAERRPWTLRDVQRAFRRGLVSGSPWAKVSYGEAGDQIAVMIPIRSTTAICGVVYLQVDVDDPEVDLAGVGRIYTGATLRVDAVIRSVDRMVARYGPYRPASRPVARPKGTSAVDGSTGLGNLTHGGDSASGEVPDGRSMAPQGGEMPPEGAQETDESSQEDSLNIAGAPQGGEMSPGGMPDGGEPSQGGSPAAQNGLPEGDQPSGAQNSSEPAQDGSESSSTPQEGKGNQSSGAHSGSSGRPRENRAQLPSLGRLPGAGPSSGRARKAWGGVHARLPKDVDMSDVRRVRRVFARLVHGGEADEGPRLDWEKAMARYLSFRPLWPARREEDGRPAVLVLADVSGSCRGFADESVQVAKAASALGVPGADVVVITHSNGYPEECLVNGRPIKVPADTKNEAVMRWYDRLVGRYVTLVPIAMGDWDAEWLYLHLVSLSVVERLLWLDNWRASVYGGPVRLHPEVHCRWAGRKLDWPPQATRKIAYVAGCGDATQFVEAIGLAIR